MKDYESTNMLPALYATFYPILRQVALDHGYALALHGSLSRDMDLIAVAWIPEPKSQIDLLKAIGETLGVEYSDEYIENQMERKPHGRIAYSLQSGGGGYLDISIV